MRLHNKIIIGFLFIIISLIISNLFLTFTILEKLQKERLKTAEVFFVKDISKNVFRDVIGEKSTKLTDFLFNEKKSREEKVEYLLIFDKKGYLLAHTYIGEMPKQLLELNNNFKEAEDYKLEKIKNNDLFVYDIAVPIMEGITQVGTIHVGIKGNYIKNIIKTTSKQLYFWIIFISLIIGVVSVFVSFFISKSISKSLTNIADVSEKISKGDLNVRAEINSKDEVGRLGKAFNEMADQIQKSHRDLEKQVKQRTKELTLNVKDLKKTKTALLNIMEDLKESNEHLKDVDKTKSEFLNIVSHELKTPLTAMFAYLDILDDMNSNLTKDELKAFDAIRRNSKQLKGLIENILEISRIAAGKFELINTEINLPEKIKGVVENLNPLAKNKGLKLIADLKNSPTEIFSDEQRLEEIINNLVSNAVKFTDSGSITIKAEKKGNFAKISIIDTGVGIPKEKLKKLGQKFYQVDASISRKYGGTGLGLSITKQLAELQGGKIEISSVEGKGSTFAVFLPIKAKGGNKDEKSTIR